MDILLRFHSHRLALAADIEKAFLMVSMDKKDRDALRFLWVDDISKAIPNVIVLHFTRVVFGVSSSPFLLNATINHHLEGYRSEDPSFVDLLSCSMYVDNVAYGAKDDNSAFELYRRSKSRLAKREFNLRKFVTNSRCLSDSDERGSRLVGDSHNTTVDDESDAKSVFGGRVDPHQKILEVCWNFINDQLVFDLSDIA